MKTADQLEEWLPLNEVFARAKKLVGAAKPALYDIKQALIDGKILARERSITRAGDDATRDLPAEFWQKAKLSVSDEYSDKVRVRAERRADQHPIEYNYYLRTSDVEKRWLSQAVPAMNEASLPPWRKSAAGAKGDYDWEKILIEAARYMWENGVPRSEAELCRHIEDWCKDDAPGESALKAHLAPLYRALKKVDGK